LGVIVIVIEKRSYDCNLIVIGLNVIDPCLIASLNSLQEIRVFGKHTMKLAVKLTSKLRKALALVLIIINCTKKAAEIMWRSIATFG
jgi:hypothetical protein